MKTPWFWLLLLAGCDDAAIVRAEEFGRQAASAPASSPAAASGAVAAPPPKIGPATSGSKAERERAVLALLAGGPPATQVAIADTDPGKAFDHGLLDKVAPASKPPQLRQGSTRVEGPGRLPPEVIQRIVRQNFGRFRLCYETELKKQPELTGKVEVTFTIEK